MKSALVSILMCLGVSIQAQVSFQCRVDSNKMLIGDQRQLLLQVQTSQQMVIDSIDFSSWNELGVELIQRPNWPRSISGTMIDELTIGVFDTGYIKLPPLPLHYQAQGLTDTVHSNDLVLEVAGITVDSTGLAPIKPILKEPLSLRDVWPYLVALLVGSLIIGWVFLRKKKSLPEPEVIPIKEPPHEIALRRLNLLDQKKLWQQGKIKEYQSELTYIIRSYLEDRYGIPALESTTTEILDAFQKQNLAERLRRDLEEILNIADLIKFAKARPEVDIHQQFMNRAENFVLSTKLQPDQVESS